MSAIVRRVIRTKKAPGAVGPYSQAVQVDKTLYISGQLGLDAETMNFVSDDVVEQTKKALANIGHILDAAGSSFEKVVKTTVLLADINDFSKVNEVYMTYFKAPFPARAAFQVASLPKLGRVEIEAVAVVGDVIDQGGVESHI